MQTKKQLVFIFYLYYDFQRKIYQRFLKDTVALRLFNSRPYSPGASVNGLEALIQYVIRTCNDCIKSKVKWISIESVIEVNVVWRGLGKHTLGTVRLWDTFILFRTVSKFGWIRIVRKNMKMLLKKLHCTYLQKLEGQIIQRQYNIGVVLVQYNTVSCITFAFKIWRVWRVYEFVNWDWTMPKGRFFQSSINRPITGFNVILLDGICETRFRSIATRYCNFCWI